MIPRDSLPPLAAAEAVAAVRFDCTWRDDDGTLRIEAGFRLRGAVAYQDFYCPPAPLREFASRLQRLAGGDGESALFEVGQRGGQDYSWVRLEVRRGTRAGWGFLAVGLSNNLGTEEFRQFEFGAECALERLRELGERLDAWCAKPVESLVCELGAGPALFDRAGDR